jgi:XRE family transcriptional regulator, master regulator for biofilm formation
MPRAHRTHKPSRAMLQRIGRNIAKRRRQRGWSQLELAQLMDVDKMTLSRIERGLSNFAIGILENLAKILGVSLHDLLRP